MTYQKFINSKQFKKELESSGIPGRRYLFLGEEEGEKDKFINMMTGMILPDSAERGLSLSRFHIENNEFMEAASFALSSSMFSPGRICVLYNINQLAQDKNTISIFNEMNDELPEDMYLIMTSRENRPPKFIDSGMLNSIKTVQFWRYFDSDIRNYVNHTLSKHDIRIDEEVFNHLISMTGKDIKKIDDSLDAIIHSGLTGQLTLEDTVPLVEDMRDVSIFELVDAVFIRSRKSVYLLKKIMDEGTPELFIINMLARQADMIEKYHVLSEQGSPSGDILKKCGIPERAKDSFMRQVSGFNKDSINRVFRLLAAADYAVKSYRISREFISSPALELVFGIINIKADSRSKAPA